MQTAISVAIDATLITMVFALAAFGLAIIYGLVGVINLGHGAMLTLGAYFTWAAVNAEVPFFLAVILAGLGVGLIGLLFEHLVIRHFYDRPFDTLLLTWGFFLISTELVKIVFGSSFRNVPSPLPGALDLGFYEVPAYRAFIAVLTLALLAGAALVFFKTNLGIKIRALIQNQEMAGLLGLNIAMTYKLVFGFGAFMAGLAGGLIAPMLSIDPYIGNIFLVRSFFVVIVGGIGQLLSGTLLGSFFIGGSETIIALFSSQVVAQMAVFLLAIVILRFRPQGLMSER
ncbi:branched-chain amino acid ABC transporter permease [Rhodoligotrophos defluvii]|uniref:branched-chain amino acid ABC transporter permease n=1 Tax=Rhodoligotrophos defluvii TaxID=2561934 RepID=UPI0010C9C132|nr:branched-chain amino acid ABC transporter permease [Rhodoligotrophos defluvii]